MRVLVVEDDADVSDALSSALALESHHVDVLRDGAQALAACQVEKFDAIILDLGLPRVDGLEVLRRLREAGHDTPILVLTARDQIDDRVRGLDAGADDYLAKPFDMYELSARLRALARRSHGRATPSIVCGDVHLNPATRRVTCGGELIELPPKEYSILFQLMDNAGQVVSRERLMAGLYGWEVDDIDSNTVDVHIFHLRRKLGREFVRTVRGVGFIVGEPAA